MPGTSCLLDNKDLGSQRAIQLIKSHPKHAVTADCRAPKGITVVMSCSTATSFRTAALLCTISTTPHHPYSTALQHRRQPSSDQAQRTTPSVRRLGPLAFHARPVHRHHPLPRQVDAGTPRRDATPGRLFHRGAALPREAVFREHCARQPRAVPICYCRRNCPF